MYILQWISCMGLIVLAFSCKKGGYTLVQEDVFDKKAIFCSTTIEDISSYTKLLSLLSKDGAVGMYKRSSVTANLCYLTSTGNGRVSLESLSGGKAYMLAERKQIKCKPDFSYAGNYCFRYDYTPGNIAQKVSSCVNLQGKIVKVDSAEKASAMRNFLLAAGGIQEYTFIGLKDIVGDNQLSSYKWMADNSTLTYSDFNSAEPGSTFQQCVVLKKAASFRWHDTSCNLSYAALCEAEKVSYWV